MGPRIPLLSFFLCLFLGACGPSTPGTRTADDQDVTRDLLWEFRKDPRFTEVRVTCYDRTITLEGTVPDRWMKRMAEDVAEDTAGVKQVHNRLRIEQSNGAETSGSSSKDRSASFGSTSGATSGTSSGTTTGSSGTSSGTTSGSEKSRTRGNG